MTKTDVLVLGAGFAGLELSTRLSSSLADQVRVTLVDANDSFFFGFSKFDIVFGRKSTDDIRMHYRDIAKDGVEFRQERVTSIDPVTRRVTTDASAYEPDLLVVALGADYEPEATPGFVEGGHEFYSLAGAERLRDALAAFEQGKIVIAILRPPFKCPPAPFESAFLLHDDLTARGIRERVEIRMFSPMPSPIPVSAETSAAIVAGLAERGIDVEFARRVVGIDTTTKAAELDDGRRLSYDLFIGIPKHRVPDVVEASGLTAGGADGWIHVDPRSLRTPFDGVYALGDCADAPVPRAGVFAESAAHAVADDIAARLRGGEFTSPFDGRGSCYIEFGGGLVGKVDADFLSGPEPIAPFRAPSEALAREKAEFAASRKERWFK